MSDTERQADYRTALVVLRAALARAGIQAYLLLNGAAAVALLGFLSNLATMPATDARLSADLPMLKIALTLFTAGVGISAATYWIAYGVHTHHMLGHHGRAERLRFIGLAINVTSLLLFMIGIVISSRAISAQ